MDPARMFKESLTSCPELENSQGQSRRFAPSLTTSTLPPTADITHRDHHFRKVPVAEVMILAMTTGTTKGRLRNGSLTGLLSNLAQSGISLKLSQAR